MAKNLKSVGQVIKAIREAQVPKYQDFAEILGISPDTVRSLETSRRNPSAELAMKIADMAQDSQMRREILRFVGITPERCKSWFPELGR